MQMSKFKRIWLCLLVILCISAGSAITVYADSIGDVGGTGQGDIGGTNVYTFSYMCPINIPPKHKKYLKKNKIRYRIQTEHMFGLIRTSSGQHELQ